MPLNNENTLHGSCHCNSVTFTVTLTTTPSLTLSAYCHCTNCQRLNGAPFIWTTHWSKDALSFPFPSPTSPTPNTDLPPDFPNLPPTIATYCTIPNRKYRLRCATCGTSIGSYNLLKQEFSIWPTLLDRDEEGKIVGRDKVEPTGHQFYGTRVVDVRDGLGKWEGYEGKSARMEES